MKKRPFRKGKTVFEIAEAGLEPARPNGHGILSPERLFSRCSKLLIQFIQLESVKTEQLRQETSPLLQEAI